MNTTSNPTEAQPSSAGGTTDSVSYGRVWGNAFADPFDNPSEWLNSLTDGLAAYRDLRRHLGETDEAIAECVERLEHEATTLQFRLKREGTSGAFNVAAVVTNESGIERTLHVDRFTLSSADRRMQFAAKLANSHPAINAAAPDERLMLIAAQPPKAESEPQKPAVPSSEQLLQQMPQEVRDEAKAALEDPDLLRRIVNDIQAIGVAGEADLIAQLYLTGTSRLLPEPVKCICTSPSSTGKTVTINKVAACFPPEQVINVTSITSQALFYFEDTDALKHKFLIQGERKKAQTDEQADATSAIRQMISDGRISKLCTDTSVKPPVTRRVEIEGPVAYCESTTSGPEELFAEDANRCILVGASEEGSQTRRVIQFIAKSMAGSNLVDAKAIVERHHAMQRMLSLQAAQVVIPFAERLANQFHSERPEARRAFTQLCGMIKAAAILYQFQRQLDDEGRIIATLDDYEVAAQLCRTPLARSLGGQVSGAAIRFHERLLAWPGAAERHTDDHTPFKVADAAKADNKSDQAIRGWLKELERLGAVEQTQPAAGSRGTLWSLTGMPQSEVRAGGFELPTLAELEGTAESAADRDVNGLHLTTTFAGGDDDIPDGAIPF